MLTKSFNIAVLSTEQNLIHLLNGIFGSIEHNIFTANSEKELLNILYRSPMHLIIADQQNSNTSKDWLNHLLHAFPEIPYIIISDNSANLELWSKFKRVNFVRADQIETRLPSLLSSIYEAFNEANVSNLEYFDLIKKALEENPTFTAIVHLNGTIIFLNRSAREILKIDEEEIEEHNFSDFLKEGEKVWQFLTMHWNEQSKKTVNIELTLTDKHFNEFVLPVLIQIIKNKDVYFIIQGKTLSDTISTSQGYDSQTLLKAFSESLANDLLNPLNVIWGRLQLILANSKFEDNESHNFELIEKQLSRINEVITKLTSVTAIKRDQVPQRVFLNDIFTELVQQTYFQDLLRNQHNTLKLELDALPPFYGQAAQIELLLTTLVDLIFKLTGSNTRLTISNEKINKKDDLKNIIINFIIGDITSSPDQVLLKNCLQFNRSEKKKFALEMTIIRYLLDEYQIKHHLKEYDSSLKLSLVFPLS